LKLAIHRFESLKRIQELPAHLAHGFRLWSELLGMLDGESDAVDGDARLIGHLELHWRGPGVRPSLNQLKDLFREFAFHICSLPYKDSG
jgi:hypothetical protein